MLFLQCKEGADFGRVTSLTLVIEGVGEFVSHDHSNSAEIEGPEKFFFLFSKHVLRPLDEKKNRNNGRTVG